MEQTFFPVTRREAERSGTKYSSEKNKNAGFPSRLRELRKKKGVSQDIVSKELGVSKSTVGLWETGDTLPDAKAVRDLALYYEVSTDYLLGRTDISSLEMETREICNHTGLIESVVEWLHYENSENMEILNLLLSNRKLRRLVHCISELKALIDENSVEFQELTENLQSDDPDDLEKKIVSQYAELAKQIGGLHIVDDYEYFHMKEYNIDKKLSEIVESILYCDADENVKTMKELIFDIY